KDLELLQESLSRAQHPTGSASNSSESSDSEYGAGGRSTYTDAVLHTVYQSNADNPDIKEWIEGTKSTTTRSKAYRAGILITIVSLIVIGSLVYFTFGRSHDKKKDLSKNLPKVSDVSEQTGVFGISGARFNVNRFNGNFWLFNLGAPVNDSSIDEILKSPHSKRLWFDSGSLSPEAIIRLKPIGVVAFAMINIDLTKKHFDSLSQLTTIKALRLFTIPTMTDESLVEIGKLNNLTELFIRSSDITDAGVAHLQPLTNLKILSLDRCTKLTDRCVDTLEKMKNLERLSLTETAVSKAGILRVAKMKNLNTISVAKLPCDSECIRALTKLNLVRLSLRFVQISQSDLIKLSQLKNLKLLDARDCGLTKKDFKAFNAAREARGLPECLLLLEKKTSINDLGEMVFETLDYEHMWTDWSPNDPDK
ncbi:MAG: hypothetical protein K2Z81_26015, partial [Cyanobacteria bacterium]|nr:hypothetical protein [Cyanobacteriota bacterium]